MTHLGIICPGIYFAMAYTGFPQALETWKTWKIINKNSMHGKIMEFDKSGKIMENSWNFVKSVVKLKAQFNFKSVKSQKKLDKKNHSIDTLY